MSFVCILRLDLHLPDNADLKGKRKEVSSLKAQLQSRFGAAVAEVDHHDLWQRATLSIALVGREAGPLGEHADALRRFVDARLGDLTRWERRTFATDDLSGS
jgi:uncharacterized protein